MTQVPPEPRVHLVVDPDLPPELPRQRLRPDLVALVFAGGCVGGWIRYEVTQAAHGPAFGVPWATLAVNVAGAFLLGVVVGVDRNWRRHWVRPLLGTGVCGALTTFGGVVVVLARQSAHGHSLDALLYGALTVALSLSAVVAGSGCTRRW